MKPYHPDDSGMTWRERNRNGGNNGGGNSMGGMMPGQIKGMANDLQMGYGGTDAKWKNYLHNVYSPVKTMGFNFGGGGNGNGGNNGGGGNNDPRTPGGTPNDPNVFDPSSPRNKMSPMAMQRPMMQTPQMGLLNAQMPQQMQQGLLGDLDPAILSYLTRR